MCLSSELPASSSVSFLPNGTDSLILRLSAALGCLGLVFSWVLLALEFLVWCYHRNESEASFLCHVLALLKNKEQAVHLAVHAYNLRSWVHSPDSERVDGLNEMIKHVWPFIW